MTRLLLQAFAILALIIFAAPASAQSCLQTCDNSYNVCIKNCQSAQTAGCIPSCMNGYEGCKGRCGRSQLTPNLYSARSAGAIQLAQSSAVCPAGSHECGRSGNTLRCCRNP